jgi:hypothetical protein
VVTGLPEGVRAVKRVGANGRAYRFVMNYLPARRAFPSGPPSGNAHRHQTVSGDVTLPPRGVLVLDRSQGGAG